MNRVILFMLFKFTALCTRIYSSDCRVVEYPDRNEVMCEGDPANTNSKAVEADRRIDNAANSDIRK